MRLLLCAAAVAAFAAVSAAQHSTTMHCDSLSVVVQMYACAACVCVSSNKQRPFPLSPPFVLCTRDSSASGELLESFSANSVSLLNGTGPVVSKVPDLLWVSTAAKPGCSGVVSRAVSASTGLAVTRTIMYTSFPSGDGLGGGRAAAAAAAAASAAAATFCVSDEFTNTNGTTAVTLGAVDSVYSFVPDPSGASSHAWSPALKLDVLDVSPHWTFKTPAVMLKQGAAFAAVVANITGATAADLAAVPPFLDVTVSPTASLTFGAAHTQLSAQPHIYTRDTPGQHVTLAAAATTTLRSALLFPDASTSALPEQQLATFVWRAFGRQQLHATPALQTNVKDTSLTTFHTYRTEAWEVVAPSLYSSAPCSFNASATCGTLASKRLPTTNNGKGTTQDGWFTILLQTLRTALGMSTYAAATSNADLLAKAQSVANLATSAPQNSIYGGQGGPMPSISYFDDGGTGWVGTSGDIGLCRLLPRYDIPEECDEWWHTAANSWTGFWLVQFFRADTSDTRLLPFAVDYAHFLKQAQRFATPSTGNVPAYWIFNET